MSPMCVMASLFTLSEWDSIMYLLPSNVELKNFEYFLSILTIQQIWFRVFGWACHTQFWALSNSTSIPAHSHPLPTAKKFFTPTHPKQCPIHPHSLQPTQNQPTLTQNNVSITATHTKYSPITQIYSNFSLIKK